MDITGAWDSVYQTLVITAPINSRQEDEYIVMEL